MGLSSSQMRGLGVGLQFGGMAAQSIDADSKGLEDDIGKAAVVAGIALSQLSTGESVSKRKKAAQALRAVGQALVGAGDELEAE